MSAAIEQVLVVGGGIVGWSAAAALRRRTPHLQVTVLASPPSADALAERITSTLPSIAEFHSDLGLRDEDAVLRARSSYRLATVFAGWVEDQPPYVHAYGDYGTPLGAASFHQHWLRVKAEQQVPPFDSFSLFAQAARHGRMVPPGAELPQHLGAGSSGLEINPSTYREMMRALALHLGAREEQGEVAEVTLRSEDGHIAAVRTVSGADLHADLFIDCTGPEARLRRELGGAFESWSHWLLCDRVTLAEAPPEPSLPAVTQVRALDGGWQWAAPSLARTMFGITHCSRHSDEEIVRGFLLREPGSRPLGDSIALAQGRWGDGWRGNCVAVGDSAVSVEPLEWTNLHLAHSAIDRIISMLPSKTCAPIELAEYNRQNAAEANRIRDFLILHYVTAKRPEPFWKEASAVSPPETLAHTLSLFRERGRLPFYEEETFSKDSWLAVLLGQSVIPRRYDPLVESTPAGDSVGLMRKVIEGIEAIGPRLPGQIDYFRAAAGQAGR